MRFYPFENYFPYLSKDRAGLQYVKRAEGKRLTIRRIPPDQIS